MNTKALPKQEGTDFKAEAVRRDSGITAFLVGTADVRVVKEMDQFVAELHEAALAEGLSKLDIDLRHLEFMSSSCFKSLVSWLARMQDLGKEQRYEIHFLCDPKLMWQRRGLRALTCFVEGLVSVHTEPTPQAGG
jgi:hypothetical protein